MIFTQRWNRVVLYENRMKKGDNEIMNMKDDDDGYVCIQI